MKRLYNLDYLRGLAAFGIMVYHYLSWSVGKYSAESFMGRLGLYGVAIFYVLSGLTLYYVYYNKMNFTKEEIFSFVKKRIFRIFPLLWLVTIIAIIISMKIPDLINLFLNLSGLFGFVSWDKYFSPGVWSIGNELVFYAFFPFFILFSKQYKYLMFLLSVCIFTLFINFTFFKLNPSVNLSDQWKDYSNPLNQVFLFLSGYLIGYFLHNVKINNSIVILLLAFGIVLFTFYPVTGDAINLVTGNNRLIFTSCSLIICISFYKLNYTFPKFIHNPLTLLGEASYSVYLLHPIIYKLTRIAFDISNKYILPLPNSVRILTSIILTLFVSYFVYQYFEKYFMKFGKTNKNNLNSTHG